MSPGPIEIPWRSLFVTTVVVNLYVQLSELIRYLYVVQPRLQAELAVIEGVGRIEPGIFAIWGAWGTLLSAMIVATYWLISNTAQHSIRSAITAGVFTWAFAFVILWVGVANMQISTWALPALALPLALIETVTASLLTRWLMSSKTKLGTLT